MNEKLKINDPKFWRIWHDDGFRLVFPNHWEREDPLMPIIKLQIHSSDNDDYFSMVGVEITDNLKGHTIEKQKDAIKNVLPNLIFGLDNLKFEEIDERIPLLLVKFDSIIEGEIFLNEMYQWIICNKVISLHFSMLRETYEEFEFIKRFMFETFKIK